MDLSFIVPGSFADVYITLVDVSYYRSFFHLSFVPGSLLDLLHPFHGYIMDLSFIVPESFADLSWIFRAYFLDLCVPFMDL